MTSANCSLRLVVVGFVAATLGVLAACSDSSKGTEVDVSDAGHDQDAPADVSKDSGPSNDSGSNDSGSNDSSSPTVTDSGPETPSNATFKVGGTFTVKKGSANPGYYYKIGITIKNTSAADLTSLDTLTYDFGDGKTVSLTEPACNGKLVLKAGSSVSIETQIGVGATSGVLNNYSNQCSSQYFGGATGSAPATDTFAGPIAITIGGKTETGTFSGTGSATRQ